jgi:multiple sugar transport system permease protein
MYVFRAIYYLPTVISGVGVAMLWRWIFNGQYGIINTLLHNIGYERRIGLLTKMGVDGVDYYQRVGCGWDDVDFLGGVRGIPQELMEAAEIDGAGR